MASELSRDELRRLARIGAARRLEELRQEEAAIRAAFPDLDDERNVRRATRGRARPAARSARAADAASAATAASAAAKPRRARYKMSAAQKRAVSERMKKYWAARRKAKG